MVRSISWIPHTASAATVTVSKETAAFWAPKHSAPSAVGAADAMASSSPQVP